MRLFATLIIIIVICVIFPGNNWVNNYQDEPVLIISKTEEITSSSNNNKTDILHSFMVTVDVIPEPYHQLWIPYLEQLELDINDPNKHFSVKELIPEPEKPNTQMAVGENPDFPDDVVLFILPLPEDVHHNDILYASTMLMHEYQHIVDRFELPEIQNAENAWADILPKYSYSSTIPPQADMDIMFNAASARLVSEMRASNTGFDYAFKATPEVYLQLCAQYGTVGSGYDVFATWTTRDNYQFAKACYESSQEDIYAICGYGYNIPQNILDEHKEKTIEIALESDLCPTLQPRPSLP